MRFHKPLGKTVHTDCGTGQPDGHTKPAQRNCDADTLRLCTVSAGAEQETKVIGIHTKASIVDGHKMFHDLRKIVGGLPKLLLRIFRQWKISYLTI